MNEIFPSCRLEILRACAYDGREVEYLEVARGVDPFPGAGWRVEDAHCESVEEPIPTEADDWDRVVDHEGFLLRFRQVPIPTHLSRTVVAVEPSELARLGRGEDPDFIRRIERIASVRAPRPERLRRFRQGHVSTGAVILAWFSPIDANPGFAEVIRAFRSDGSPWTGLVEVLIEDRVAVVRDWGGSQVDLWLVVGVIAGPSETATRVPSWKFDTSAVATFYLRLHTYRSLVSRAQEAMRAELAASLAADHPRRAEFQVDAHPVGVLDAERELMLGRFRLGRWKAVRHHDCDEPVWYWLEERMGFDDSIAHRREELDHFQRLNAALDRRRAIRSTDFTKIAIVGLNLLTLISTWATFLQVVDTPNFPEGIHHLLGRSMLERVTIVSLAGVGLLFLYLLIWKKLARRGMSS